jgi:5-bromo-4-chloroindolyl phosphate hydrolysis protein
MSDLESLLNPEEIEAFLKGKPVSDEFITQLEEHTKALVEKLETITKDLRRPGDGSSQTELNES